MKYFFESEDARALFLRISAAVTGCAPAPSEAPGSATAVKPALRRTLHATPGGTIQDGTSWQTPGALRMTNWTAEFATRDSTW